MFSYIKYSRASKSSVIEAESDNLLNYPITLFLETQKRLHQNVHRKATFQKNGYMEELLSLIYSKVAAGITHITPFRNLFPPWTSLSESQSHFRGFVLWCFFTSVTQRQLSPQSIIKKFIIHGKVAALTNLTFRASNFPLSKLASEQGLTLESFTHLLRGLNYLYPLQHNKLPSVSCGGRRSPNVSVIL